MPNKIGIVLALDGEEKFTNGMKSALESSKKFDAELKNLENEYKGNANSLDALTKKQDLLKQKQEAANRQVEAAKNGLSNAKKNYRDAGEALDKYSDELEEARKELQRMDDAGEKGTSAYKKQARAVETLEKKVSKQASEQQKASANITKWETNVIKADGAVKKINTDVDKNSKYLKEAQTSSDKCAKSIDKMGNEMKDTAKDTEQMSGGLKNAISVMAGNLMSQGVSMLTDGLKDAAQYVVEVGSNFEASMSKVEALSGASAEQLQSMSDKARELGSSTQYSASQVADAFSYMSLAGWSTEDMLSSIDGVLNLAAASQMDLAQASDMVTDYLSAFGLSAENAGHMADMLAYAQANSNTTTTQLGDAFGNCAANMNAAGQDMETTTAILEGFANQGLKGSEAGTKLAAIMRDITAKMKDGKIQIGDTAVAVQDADGNFRDLTDILADVESATNGMGDAQKASALAATFTSRSVSGLNMILNEGVGNIANYEEALRNSDGAAAEMAATMTDNLQGKMTEFGSALEGLGIEAYNAFSTPLSGIVGFATGIINGITDMIKGETDDVSSYLDALQKTNDAVEEAMQHAQETVQNAQTEAAGVGLLSEQLISLNEQETLSEGQKLRLKAVVDELSKSIPDLAEAYDEETGKVNLTSEAIRGLVQAKQDEIRQNAYLKATTELIEKQAQAALELELAYGQKENLEKQADLYADLAGYVQGASNAYSQYLDAQRNGENTEEAFRRFVVERGKAIKALDEAYRTGKISLEEYKKAQEEIDEIDWANTNADAWNSAGDAAETFAGKSGEAARAAEEMGDGIEELEENADQLTTQLDQTQAAIDNLTTTQEDAGDAAEHTGKRISGEVDDLNDYKKAASDAADETEDLEAAEKRLEEAAKAAEKAHDSAAEGITKAYEDIKKSVESAFSVDAFGEWGANAENGIAKFTESMQTQATAMAQYKANLETVREAAGENGTQFVHYLEEMGEAGSQLVAELANDPSQLDAVMEQWSNAMNISSDIQNAQTANILAEKLMLKDMSSTIADWSELGNAVASLGLKSQNQTKKAFEQAVAVAQEMGVAIPEGLTESILENSDHPEEALQSALDQLNAAISGQGEAVVSACKDLGIQVPQEITDGIAAGGDSAVQAYGQLIQMLTDKAPEMGAAAKAGGEEAAQSLESTSGEMSEAADTVIQSAVDSMGTTIKAFRPVGELAGGGIINGLGSRKGDVSDKAKEVVNAGKTSADKAAEKFSETGSTAGSQFSSGLSSQRSAAVSAGSSVASGAKAAAASWTNSFYSVGVQMSQGISQGIMSQARAIASAAANVVRQALNAARAEAQIQSPSKKFQRLVGAQISAGVAWGIRQNTGLAVEAAEALIGQTLAAMDTRLGNARASMSEITYAWQQTAGQMIQNGFGISRTQTSNGQTTQRSDEDYYRDVYRAAETFMENLRVLYDVSEEEELAYWQRVQASLRRGTQAWYDATARINELTDSVTEHAAEAAQRQQEIEQERLQAIVESADNYLESIGVMHSTSIKQEIAYWEAIRRTLTAGTEAYQQATNRINQLQQRIGTISNADSILSTYQLYHEMSEGEEVEYWDIIRQQYAAGTQERIEADQRYLDAKKRQMDKLKALEEDYQDKVEDVNRRLADRIDELNKKYTDAVKTRQDAIMNSFNLTDYFESTSVDGQTLLFNMQSQAEGYEYWEQQLAELSARGILSDELLQELADMGPSAVATVVALNSLSDSDLQAYMTAYNKKADVSHRQAEHENEGLRQEVEEEIMTAQQQAAQELHDLRTDFDTNTGKITGSISGGLRTLASDIRNISEDEARLFAAAIQGGGTLTDSGFASSTGSHVSSSAIASASGTNAIAHNGNAVHDAAAEILSVGSKRSKTLKASEQNFSDLFRYIVTKYGVQPGQAMYKALAQVLGVTVSDKVTGSQMNDILAALKKAGLRHGTKYLEDAFAWMDEAGLGSEMIVRKSDGAILNTAVQRGDAIIPADLTENLYRWGAYNPDLLIPEVMSAARMNAMAESGYRSVSEAGGRVESSMLEQMLGLMTEFLPYMAEKTHIVMDGDKLVDYASQNLAMRSRRYRG